MSCGTLIRAGGELRVGSEWPLILELTAVLVKLTGRGVRRERAEVPLPGGAALQRSALGFMFVSPSREAKTVLEEVCGTAMEAGDG